MSNRETLEKVGHPAQVRARLAEMVARQSGPATIQPTSPSPSPGKLQRQRERLRHQLNDRLSRSTDGLELIRGRGGQRTLDTKGRFGSAHIARRTSDGTYAITCVTSNRELDRELAKVEVSR